MTKSVGDRIEEDISEIIFDYEVCVQCLEIYMEDLRKLLVLSPEFASSSSAFVGCSPRRPPQLRIRDMLCDGSDGSTVETEVVGAT